LDVFSKYIPMTETAYYILLALKAPLHGYGIIQNVEKMTEGRLRLGAGTIYGTLSKLLKDDLIDIAAITERRKIYKQSELGKLLIQKEISRIIQLIEHAKRSGYFEEI
jgi:DNA-binding PadR family transcriptional regulator